MAIPARRRPLVSVCIPAYRSLDDIRATIHSALNQTVQDVEIIVSRDGGEAIPALEPLRRLPRVRIVDPPMRLGWVQNSNYALSKATGAYFMILPHDDRLAPTYLESCLHILESEPSCFAVYSDIAWPGGVLNASEVRGNAEQRARHVMCNLYNGYSYRALMRRQPEHWDRLRMLPNPPTNFCADSTWILQQASFGELRRVPLNLYWKGQPPTSVHAKWPRIPPRQLHEAWTRHCTQMGQIARTMVSDAALIAELVAHRLDARRVAEAPDFLKTVCASAADGRL